MSDLIDQAVSAALKAEMAHAEKGREIVWTLPPGNQVRRLIAAAEPLIRAAERERIAVMADEEHAVCTDPNEGTTVPFSAFLRAQSGGKEGTEP